MTGPLRLAARIAVGLTVRALPTWEVRLRYRDEFLADLHGLPSAGQLRYAAGVLSQTFALRAALGASRAPVQATNIPVFLKLRCRVLRWHDWRTFSNPDGERYRACSICGCEEIDQPPGGWVGAWGAG